MRKDNRADRSKNITCVRCMHFASKGEPGQSPTPGRCRRHAPTGEGWPVLFDEDWCGDFKLFEKIEDVIEELLQERDFLYLQLEHAYGNISDEEFEKLAEPFKGKAEPFKGKND